VVRLAVARKTRQAISRSRQRVRPAFATTERRWRWDRACP
jgi:hypothetical protein